MPAVGGRREELLAAVLADPSREHCAVYADHLQELGDPRGEFIGLDIALAGARQARRPVRELRARRNQLFEAHARSWWPWPLVYHRSIGGTHVVHGTRLGFLHRVAAEGDEMADLGQVLDREPVRDLELRHYAGGLPGEGPMRLERLALTQGIDSWAYYTLIRSPLLAGLRDLSIRSMECPYLGVLEGQLPGLRRLDLRLRPIDPREMQRLVAWEGLQRLEALTLAQCGLILPMLDMILVYGPYPHLVELDLRWNPFGEDGVLKLCSRTHLFPALRYLQVSTSRAASQRVQARLRETVWPAGPMTYGPRPWSAASA